MKKRMIALLMILVLGLSCLTACGDKDDDEKKGKKKSAKSYETVYDVVDAMQEFKKGTVILTIDADAGEDGIIKGTINAVCDGKGNFKLGIAADVNTKDQKFSVSADDILIVKDKMAYINLGAILKAADMIAGEGISEMFADMKLGYFAIPLPDDLDTAAAFDTVNTTVSGTGDFLRAALKDAEVKGEDGDFTVKFTNAQSYKTFIGATADYIEKKTPELTKAVNTEDLKKIDLNAYVKKLLDYYGEDINILAGAIGIEQAQVDALIEQIKAQDLNAALAGAVDEKLGNTDALKSELAEAVTELRKTAEQITDEQVKDQQLEFNVKVTDAGYKIKGNAVLKENNKEVKIDYSVRISEDVSSISAPSDITRLRDFKDLVASLGGMIGGMMN
ncbi:MAG: hypothetical protein J5643_10790 [Lachnospiraceae bacterium]|nr:hypothetical protein [Lachnospiraceae bacterium]